MQPIGSEDAKGSISSPNQRIARLKSVTPYTEIPSQQLSETNESWKTAASTIACEHPALMENDDFPYSSLSAQEPIIAVMGPTSAGKSTLVKIATGSDDVKVGDDLSSCTQEIQVVRCRHPFQGYDVLFVDTPGFDDTWRTDMEILQGLADWLEKTYRQGIQLSGILYLHRITDNRMSNTLLRNLDLFRKLCGDDALSNIRLVTTHWDLLPNIKEGERIEKELCEEYWRPFIASGAQVHRFQYSCASAWEIVNTLPMERKSMQIQKELVDQNKSLLHTSAGQTLFSSTTIVLQELITWLEKLVTRITSSPLSSGVSQSKQEQDTTKLKEAKEELQRLENLRRLPRRSPNWHHRRPQLDPAHSSDETEPPSRRGYDSSLKLRRRVTRLQKSLQKSSQRAAANTDFSLMKNTTPDKRANNVASNSACGDNMI